MQTKLVYGLFYYLFNNTSRDGYKMKRLSKMETDPYWERSTVVVVTSFCFE